MGSRINEAHSLLGVPGGASLADIKAAYRRQALKLHPDMKTGNHEAFRQLTAAYNLLSASHSYSSSQYMTPADFRRARASSARSSSFFSSNLASTQFASRVWGTGLAIGCSLFAAVLLLGRMDLFHRRYEYVALTSEEQRHGRAVASRRVEPTMDGEKRRRIAAVLLQRQHAGEGGKK